MIALSAILHSRIPEIIAVGEDKVAEAVQETANQIVNDAMVLSRVDTGNMRANWQKDDWSTGTEHVARVFNNVYYTIYNEYGTVYMSAQPMLGPAVEKAKPDFEERIKAAYA